MATARALAAVGRPVAIWDIHADKAISVAAIIAHKFSVATVGVGIDIADIGQYDKAIGVSRNALGMLGGLVHSAGIVDTGSLEGITEQTWEKGMNINWRPLAVLA